MTDWILMGRKRRVNCAFKVSFWKARKAKMLVPNETSGKTGHLGSLNVGTAVRTVVKSGEL